MIFRKMYAEIEGEGLQRWVTLRREVAKMVLRGIVKNHISVCGHSCWKAAITESVGMCDAQLSGFLWLFRPKPTQLLIYIYIIIQDWG